MAEVKGSKIIERGWQKDSVDGAKEFIKYLELIADKAKLASKELNSNFSGANTDSAKAIKEVIEAYEKSNKIVDDSIALDKEKVKLQKQLSELEDEQVKAKLRFQKANAEQRKALKAELDLQNKQLGTLPKLKAANTKLRMERDKLNLSTKEGVERLKQINSQIDRNNQEIEKNTDKLGKQKIGIGRYEKAVKGLTNVLGKLGIAFGLVAIKDFLFDLNRLAQESKGVEFAFNAIGERGVDAFERIKESTRGLLSDLDIKKSLVEFDNFNISLEETDVLMEFLAVRATQTGVSVDKLKDSLVEGLSKESKLRIDNLGISTAELNSELEKTPNFVEAVANIAKKEVAEAGAILDEAASGQSKWNAQLENFQLLLADKVKPIFDSAFEKGASVLKFVGDNLELIINTLSIGVKAFVSYKVATFAATNALKVYNVVQALATKGLKSFNAVSKLNPFGFIVSALTVGIPLIIDLVKYIGEAEERTNALLRVENKLTKQMNEQKVEFVLLRKEIDDTNVASEERQELIDSINEKYGTTLENLKDETEFMHQLEDAYKGVITQMENRLRAQLREEELKDLLKQEMDLLSEIEAIKDEGILSSAIFGTEEFNKEKARENLAIVRDQIKQLEGAISESDINIPEKTLTTSGSSGGNGSGGSKSKEDIKNEELKAFKEIQDDKLKELELSLRRQGASEDFISQQLASKRIELERETLRKIEELNFEDKDILRDAEIKHRKFVEANQDDILGKRIEDNEEAKESNENYYEDIIKLSGEAYDKELEALEKRKEALRELVDYSIDAFKDIADAREKSFDKQIDQSNEEINESREVINTLNEQGTANAALSIKAQEQRIAKEKLEIDELERKKRNLLLITTGLERVSDLIAGGSKSPFQTAGNEIASFIESLPAFDLGTEYSVADALGRTNTVDGHLARVGDEEHIVGTKDAVRLHSNGIYKTSDIVNNAIKWKNRDYTTPIIENNDHALLKEIERTRKVIENQPVQTFDYDKLLEFIRKGNTIKRVDHSNNGRII